MPWNFSEALRGQKAIGAHPALMGSDPVSVYQPGAARQDAKLSDRDANRHLEAYGGRQAMDAVANAVDLYATSSAGAKWRLQKPDGTRLVEIKGDHDPKDTEIGPKDLYELLRNPNPFMMYSDLVQLLIIDLLMVGNGYWMKWRTNDKGQPLAIYRLAPGYVKVIPGDWGPKRYEYQLPGQRDPMKIPLENMIHFKLPNPSDAYYGMGVIRKGGRIFDMELSVTETMASYYANKADPSLIVESERRVPRDVFNKLRAQLRARVATPHNAGELLVLEAGLKANTLSPSARDALFDTISGLTARRIYAMYRTSPLLFGIMENATTADALTGARREFDTYVLRPFLDRLQERITAHLVAAWEVEFKIDYNYVIPQDELLKNVSTLAAIPGIKVRELRRALLPLGFLDGESTGDSEIDEEILNMPMEEMDEDGQGGAPDRPLAGEAGRPPKGKNTTSFSKSRTPKKPAGKALSDPSDVIERMRAAVAVAETKAVVLEPEYANTSVGRKLDAENRPADPTAGSRAQAVDETAAYIERGIGDALTALERAMLDHAEGKAFRKADVVNRMRKSEAWKTFRAALENVLLEAGRRAAQGAALDMGESGRYADDLDYDAIASQVVHRKGGLTGIVNTLKRRLTAKLANLGDTATKADADAIIQEHIREYRTGQASVIGVTEAVHLYNEAVLSILEENGETEVYVTDGEDDDQPCKDAHDSVWAIEHARENRLEHPNCRRAFLPVPAVS